MSLHDDRIPLRHMRDHAAEVVALTQTSSRQELEESRLFQLALTRLVEIVGEAANRVSTQGRRSHPEVPWAKAIAMRNRVIHGYDILDLDMLWDTATLDLPGLVPILDRILGSDA